MIQKIILTRSLQKTNKVTYDQWDITYKDKNIWKWYLFYGKLNYSALLDLIATCKLQVCGGNKFSTTLRFHLVICKSE